MSKLKSFSIIAAITFVVFAIAWFFLFFPQAQMRHNAKKDKYRIKKIVQPKQEQISVSLLAETLDLSLDKPMNIYDFNCKTGAKKLLSTHAICKANIIKMKPDMLFIDYELREPIAIVADLSNTFVDSDGILFPIFPYYTPKRVVEVFFGLPAVESYWGRRLSDKKIEIVLNLIKIVKFKLVKVDLSHMNEPTLGRREIVVVVNSAQGLRTLRLNPKEYVQQLHNYAALEKGVLYREKGDCIIDMRILNIAYVKRL